jgi:organic radical activating enzyme
MRHKLEYAEFYITNVCNLNCPRCNRYNNYAFSGHFRWEDHANEYRAWAQRLEINRIGILGGEPMSHPGFIEWVERIAEIWPQSQIMIMSNGTYLRKYPDLFDWLDSWSGRIRLDITRHNASKRDATLDDIESLYHRGFEKFVLNSFESFSATGKHGYMIHSNSPNTKIDIDPMKIGSEIWADKSYQYVYRKNGVVIRYADADKFDESVVRLDQSKNRLYLTANLGDAEKAAAQCNCKYSHHFLDGKLYKCGVVAVLPKFLQQFPVEASQEKLDILRAYQPACHDWSDPDLQNFLDNLSQGQSIKQCSLCPESFQWEEFAATTKKIKIERIREIS